MTVPAVRDLALMLTFSVGMPLAAGAWWRYFSGYDHPLEAHAAMIVEQAPAAATAQGVREKETDVPRLAWTTSPVKDVALPAGSTLSQPEEPVER